MHERDRREKIATLKGESRKNCTRRFRSNHSRDITAAAAEEPNIYVFPSSGGKDKKGKQSSKVFFQKGPESFFFLGEQKNGGSGGGGRKREFFL